MPTPQQRQSILYLHASGPSLRSCVIAADLHEPAQGARQLELSPQPVMPYDTVAEAIGEGWRIVTFPALDNAGDDRQLGNFAYQFILERFEDVDD